jgi:hypothetical protein
MQCQRCLKDDQAHHRVQTEALDIAVCDPCAEEARQLGLATILISKFECVPELPVWIRDQER